MADKQEGNGAYQAAVARIHGTGALILRKALHKHAGSVLKGGGAMLYCMLCCSMCLQASMLCSDGRAHQGGTLLFCMPQRNQSLLVTVCQQQPACQNN